MTDISQALADPNLLASVLGDGASWSTWKAVLRAGFGLRLTDPERALFNHVAGGRPPPTARVRELVAICGRRSGKSRMAGAVSAFLASCIDYSSVLAAGETGYVTVLGPTVDQARLVFNYTLAFLERSPILSKLLENVSADEIRLHGNIVISVAAASYRSIRGRTLLAAVLDESAMFRSEETALPDLELYRAVVPALSTTRGMCIMIGTPYRKLGLMFNKYRDCFGKDDPNVLVVTGETPLFNPTIDQDIIAEAERDDRVSALTEWRAEFRTDLTNFLDEADIEGAIDHGRPSELPPRSGTHYAAYMDPSGGRGDAFALCIGHMERDTVIADVVLRRGPPLNPHSVTAEFVSLCKQYKVGRVTSDNYSAEWFAQAVRDGGLSHQISELSASDHYMEGLPLFTRGRIRIPNHQILLRELRLLERKTSKTGKDRVSHPAGGSDDAANALFGLCYLLAKRGMRSVPSSAYDQAIAAANRRPARFPGLARRRTHIDPRAIDTYAQWGGR